MAIPKITGAQHDFSAGEVDVALKRNDDHPARKAGVRQMQNWRILNSSAVQNRPGRSALFPAAGGRIEEVTMAPGKLFKLAFGNGTLGVLNSAGAVVAAFTLQGGGAALPWTVATVNQIVYAQLGLSIYITFAGMLPQVVSWDGIATWSIVDYAELVIGNQKRTFFYRISPQNITLLPGAQTGSGVSLISSAPLFTNAHVGTRMRFINRQMLITAIVGPQNATVTIEESLPGTQNLTFGSDPRTAFSLGDVIIGNTSGSKGLVTALSVSAMSVQLIQTNASVVIINYYQQETVSFILNETIVGPGGSIVISGSVSAILSPTIGVAFWDEEVMNPLRGYPASCFVDQFRVGFCNFPAIPNGIGWSAINSPTDLYVGGPAVPNGAIFELAPDKVQILYTVPGSESSEFVFCDKKVYYIKIDVQNPLKPGSVSFQTLSGEGSSAVQPRLAGEHILYAGAGGNSMMAVIATGAYYRPFNTRFISQYHNHLFGSIVAIAVPTADATFTSRYAYVLNANGSIIIGKYTPKIIDNDSIVGWSPWSGGATVTWIAALGADLIFTSNYFGTGICEILDDTQFLDSALFVNNLPAAFAPPGGKGPLWFIPSQSVTLMDQVTRVLGTYQIDANGFLIPQNNAGEDFTVASLVAGQPWTATLEPFVPDANPGTSVHQRMFKRRVSRMAVYVINSTGFLMARLFSGPVGPKQPALGTIMNQRRITAYNQDDDPTKAPFQREEAERSRPLGRAFDPRVAVIKDTPGPLLIAEFGLEASI